MVIILAIYPLLAATALAYLEQFISPGVMAQVTAPMGFTVFLCAAALASVLLAAFRHRHNTVLLSAWLFFFIGTLILALGYLIKPFMPAADSWIEELLETIALFPLMISVIYVASPLRIVMYSRAQRTLFALVGTLLVLSVAAVVFVPWIFVYEGPRLHSSAENILHLAQAILDIVLLEPVALLLIVVGFSSGSSPYVLLGLGLLVLLPEDIVGSFRLLRLNEILGQYAQLLFITSQLYIVNGALLSALRRERAFQP